MPDEARCVWCHKSGGTLKTLSARVPNVLGTAEREVSVAVHPAHETEAHRHYAYLGRYARTFLLSVLLGVAALLVFAALNWEPGSAAVMVYFGLIFVVFPFSTGTTVELMGIQNSVRLARVTGAIFIVAGLVLSSL